MDEWQVVIEPVGRNPDTDADVARDPENRGGLVIYLESEEDRIEFSRVAFVRRASKNPDTSFDDQLDNELANADAAVAALNRQAVRNELA